MVSSRALISLKSRHHQHIVTWQAFPILKLLSTTSSASKSGTDRTTKHTPELYIYIYCYDNIYLAVFLLYYHYSYYYLFVI